MSWSTAVPDNDRTKKVKVAVRLEVPSTFPGGTHDAVSLVVLVMHRHHALNDGVADNPVGAGCSNWRPLRGSPLVIDKLNKEISVGLTDPKINARSAELGGSVLAGSPAAFGKLVSDYTEKLAKVIKVAGIRPE